MMTSYHYNNIMFDYNIDLTQLTYVVEKSEY
jgi:hypothetical protein